MVLHTVLIQFISMNSLNPYWKYDFVKICENKSVLKMHWPCKKCIDFDSCLMESLTWRWSPWSFPRLFSSLVWIEWLKKHLFAIKSQCILIFNSLSGGNSKYNDSISTVYFGLGTFLMIFMRIIWMSSCISLWFMPWLCWKESDVMQHKQMDLCRHPLAAAGVLALSRPEYGKCLVSLQLSGGQYWNFVKSVCISTHAQVKIWMKFK